MAFLCDSSFIFQPPSSASVARLFSAAAARIPSPGRHARSLVGGWRPGASRARSVQSTGRTGPIRALTERGSLPKAARASGLEGPPARGGRTLAREGLRRRRQQRQGSVRRACGADGRGGAGGRLRSNGRAPYGRGPRRLSPGCGAGHGGYGRRLHGGSGCSSTPALRLVLSVRHC